MIVQAQQKFWQNSIVIIKRYRRTSYRKVMFVFMVHIKNKQ